MVEYLEVGIGGRRASARLAAVTFITGRGKSAFLEVLYKVLSNVGKKIPRIGGEWELHVQGGDVVYSIVASKNRIRQTVSIRGEEVVFEHMPSRGVHRVVKPINIAVSSADVVIPEIKTEEHVSLVAEEDIERLNSLLAEARRALSVDTQFLGPYIAPKSLVDASTTHVAKLDSHGRNLAAVLANIALYKPSTYDSIRAAFRKLGFSISVGLAKPGKLGVIVATKKRKMPLAKAPCSIKSLLTILTALHLEPDILLVDNLDYCLTPETAGVLVSTIKQKPVKLVAEIHNSDIAKWFDAVDKSIIKVEL